MNVLFICKGNINRSALAEYILKQQLQDLPQVCIRSSGTTAAFGSWGAKATKKMRDLAAARGVQNLENHRAQLTTQELIDASDLVYYMDHKNKRKLKKMFGDTLIDTRCKMLADLEEIPDPMGGTPADFDLAFEMIQDKCMHVAHQIRLALECR